MEIGKEYRNYFCLLCSRDVGFAYMGVNIPATSAVMICLNCFSKGENPMREIKSLRERWNQGGLLLMNGNITTPEDLVLDLLEVYVNQGKIIVLVNQENNKGTILRTSKQDVIPYQLGTIKTIRSK